MHDYYSYRLPSTFNNFFKSIKKEVRKYINMQPDWPLRSLIIYRKLGRIMENSVSVPVGLNSGMLLKKMYNQRVVFALKSF